MLKKSIIAEQRHYRVKVVDDAKEITFQYLENIELSQALKFGLPEVDDRYHCWRVPLTGRDNVDERTVCFVRKYLTAKSEFDGLTHFLVLI